MAIPKKIKQLTELALKDKVLTQVERQTIVKAALEMGVPEKEIDAYIRQATDERIRTIYSKEEMTHCPYCGALTPLISNQCLHCFRDLREARNITQQIQIPRNLPLSPRPRERPQVLR